MRLNRFRSYNKGRIDAWLLIGVIVLTIVGIMMISSASVVVSFRDFDTEYYYVLQQGRHLLIGLALMAITSLIDYRFWQKIAPLILILIFVFLVLPFIPGIGAIVKGAARWVNLGPVGFQPTEFVKILSIIYLASWLSKKKEEISNFSKGFLPFVVILGAMIVLILLEPDAGATLIIVSVAVAMYFAAGAPGLHFLYGFFLGLVLLVPMIIAKPYRLERILVLFNVARDTQGSAYHINQALIAIGAGGLWGLGFGQSKQKYLYLPEPHTDSIFAIMLEELGFLRTLIPIFILVFVVLRIFKIAKFAPDDFARLFAVGLGSLIAIQFLVNMGAMLGVLPLTGVTMPFISFGGSSLIALLIGVGIVLNISRVVRI